MRTISDFDLTRLHETDTRARSFTKIIAASLQASRGMGPVEHFIDDPRVADRYLKAIQPAMSSSDFGSGLVSEARAWVEILSRRTVIGQLVGSTKAPANVAVPTVTSEPAAEWVGEGLPIPFARISFDAPRTATSKLAFAIALHDELFRFGGDRMFDVIERISLRAAAHAENTKFLSADAAVVGVSPAGILAGVNVSGAGSPSTLQEDITQMWTDVSSGDALAPYFIVSPRGAMFLASQNVNGTPLFPGLGPLGGTLLGVPTIIARQAADRLILIDAAQLVITDGGLEVSPSKEASVQMVDDPVAGAASLISAFQVNAMVCKFVRFLHWLLLTDDAVSFVTLPIGGSPS